MSSDCDHRDPFLIPTAPAQKQAAKVARLRFSAGSFSDHMVLLRAFQAWQKSRSEGGERGFCRQFQVRVHTYIRHFLRPTDLESDLVLSIGQISSTTMEMVHGMRSQLLGQLRASGFVRAKGPGDIRELNKNSDNWAVVKAALAAGSYPNLARFDRDAQQLRTPREGKVRLHPRSVLLETNESGRMGERESKTPLNCRKLYAVLLPRADGAGVSGVSAQRNKASVGRIPTEWFVFDEMTRAGQLAMIRGVTAVSPVTVLIFAGPNRQGIAM